ncbi:MAG: hypothetical protein ABI680_20505 [Chthoniobacteraceae bacterium]
MAPPFKTNFACVVGLSFFAMAVASGSAQTERPWPFDKSKSSTASTAPKPPPREIPLVEKKFEELGDQDVSDYGKKALGIDPDKWKHAETENFVLHYRRVTEAKKVAREVEYDLWFIATTLNATKESYQRKSHVYVFEDEEQWKDFLKLTEAPEWSASFARGDELFLNVRRKGGGFGSDTLAHETSHAVVARLFPNQRWPMWLNEGFAEYMGGASIAASKGQTLKRHQNKLTSADMSLAQLEAITEYPSNSTQLSQLYQTSELFIRFLMNELPKDRIVPFINAILAGKGIQKSVLEIYGDKFTDWDAFMKRYERFSR